VSENVAATSPNAQSAGTFAEGFRTIFYLINIDVKDFDVDAFRNSLAPTARDKDAFVVSVAPLDEESGPYHLFFGWRLGKARNEFSIEYRPGPKKHEVDEHPPYAEEFMSWFARSIKRQAVPAHIHVRFAFAHDTHRSRFTLPQTMGDAEVYGVTMRVPTSGNTCDVSLIRGKARWFVEVIADREIVFGNFAPYSDVRNLASCVESLWLPPEAANDVH
jgi:hypothetical protein